MIKDIEEIKYKREIENIKKNQPDRQFGYVIYDKEVDEFCLLEFFNNTEIEEFIKRFPFYDIRSHVFESTREYYSFDFVAENRLNERTLKALFFSCKSNFLKI